LAIEDLRQAADLFRPIHDLTDGVDGWVSSEVSPLLANDTAGTLAAAKALHARAERSNLSIKIPGTSAFTGRSGRPVMSEYVLASTAQSVPPPAPYPIQRGLTRTMREDAQKAGDVERMQMWAGQAARLARAEPAGTITQQLWENASRLLS
jgi:NAD(P)H-dependent flavin oxidoreductase YrpB (nitropropane dioxygenase family)